MLARILLVLALCCSLGGDPTDVPVLKIGDEMIPRSKFELWLVAEHGEASVRAFGRSWLIHREATRRSLAVTDEQVAASVDALINVRIETVFRGDRDAWREELEMGGGNELAHRALRLHTAGQDIELKALVRAQRAYGEPALRAEWERLYGRDGRTLRLRLLALEVDYGVRAQGQTREEVNAQRENAEATTIASAMALRERFLAGTDFATLARDESDDSESRASGGLLEPGLTDAVLPDELINQLYSLKRGEVSHPALVRGRVLLFQLESETRTKFEAAKAAALESLEQTPVSIQEIDSFLVPLEENSPVQSLPTLDSPSGNADEPVLRVGESSITFAEFATWLRRRTGHAHSSGFTRSHLIEALAQRENLTVTENEIAQRIRDLIEIEAKFLFQGDQSKWEASLVSRGKTREMYEQHAATRARHDLLVEKALLSEREFSTTELKNAWEKKYGPAGRTLRARQISRIVRTPLLPSGTTPAEVERINSEAKEKARVFLIDLKNRIEDGEDFAALARQNSDDDVTRADGGSTSGAFRDRKWPTEIREAVTALKVGQLSDPVFYGGGWFLFELVSDERVEFESVREELLGELESTRPPAIEVAVFQKVLLEETEWQVLPAMYE